MHEDVLGGDRHDLYVNDNWFAATERPSGDRNWTRPIIESRRENMGRNQKELATETIRACTKHGYTDSQTHRNTHTYTHTHTHTYTNIHTHSHPHRQAPQTTESREEVSLRCRRHHRRRRCRRRRQLYFSRTACNRCHDPSINQIWKQKSDDARQNDGTSMSSTGFLTRVAARNAPKSNSCYSWGKVG